MNVVWVTPSDSAKSIWQEAECDLNVIVGDRRENPPCFDLPCFRYTYDSLGRWPDRCNVWECRDDEPIGKSSPDDESPRGRAIERGRIMATCRLHREIKSAAHAAMVTKKQNAASAQKTLEKFADSMTCAGRRGCKCSECSELQRLLRRANEAANDAIRSAIDFKETTQLFA